MERNLEEVQQQLDKRIREAISYKIKNTQEGNRSIRAFCKEERFSLTTISEYLNGKRQAISSDTLFRLLVVLDIDIEVKT